MRLANRALSTPGPDACALGSARRWKRSCRSVDTSVQFVECKVDYKTSSTRRVLLTHVVRVNSKIQAWLPRSLTLLTVGLQRQLVVPPSAVVVALFGGLHSKRCIETRMVQIKV